MTSRKRSFCGAVAYGEAQVPAERVGRPERARHDAATQQVLGGALRPHRLRPDGQQQEVGDAGIWRQAERRQVARRATRVRRLMASALARATSGWRRACRADGGGHRRNAARRTEALQAGDGRPLRHARSRPAGPAARTPWTGAHDDERRDSAASSVHRRAGMELDVGLVDDEDGPATLECGSSLQQRLDVRRSLQVRRWGCSARSARPQQHRAAPRSMAGMSSAKPPSGPCRGTATMRASR